MVCAGAWRLGHGDWGTWGPPRKRLSEKGSWRYGKGLGRNKAERIMTRLVFYKESSGRKCEEWIWRERRLEMRLAKWLYGLELRQ